MSSSLRKASIRREHPPSSPSASFLHAWGCAASCLANGAVMSLRTQRQHTQHGGARREKGLTDVDGLVQGSANDSPWAKPSPASVSANSVLGTQPCASIHISSVCFHAVNGRGEQLTENVGPTKPKTFTIWNMTESLLTSSLTNFTSTDFQTCKENHKCPHEIRLSISVIC